MTDEELIKLLSREFIDSLTNLKEGCVVKI